MRKKMIGITILLFAMMGGYWLGVRPRLPLINRPQWDPLVIGALIVLVIGWGIYVYRTYFGWRNTTMRKIDAMDGLVFERYIAELMTHLSFTEVHQTPSSRDFGVDVIAQADGVSYAVQCKRYDHTVDNSAVQEVYTGKDFYHLDRAVVITNQYYSSGAKQLAEGVGVRLIDRDELAEMIAAVRKG